MKDNVVDFFTRRNMNELAPVSSDAAIDQLGRYLGVLTPQNTEYARHLTTQLAQKRAQIDAMIDQWQFLYNDYALFMSDMLTFLKVREGVINPSEDDIYVDNEGHVWAIKEADKDAFMQAKNTVT